MTKKTKCLLGIAGSMLAAGSLCADPYNENFEGATSAWTGDGTITETAYQYSGIAGLPLPTDNHTKVLVIEGDSSYAPSGFSGSPLVDMMVQAALPDDALEDPDVGAHIAVAVDMNGIFNVYCKNKSGTATGWYPLSSTAYADGAWARVSLLFDYANGRCQVRLDGQPMMTTNGYHTATSTEASSADNKGAWYKLASTGTTASTAVSNLKVVGCTAIDDVVIAADASSYAVTSGATAPSGLACAWLDKYGLAWDATTAGTSYDSTGMTVAQKYDACLSPFDDQKFEVKSVTVDTAKNKTVVGIPATVDTVGRKVVLQSSSDSTFATGTATTDVAAGQETVEVALPAAGAVQYFRLRAMDK